MVAAPCQIIHVELSEHLRELELRPGYQSALIMFWWRGRPLGRTPLVAGEFPLPPASIAARAAEAGKWQQLTVSTVFDDGRFDSRL